MFYKTKKNREKKIDFFEEPLINHLLENYFQNENLDQINTSVPSELYRREYYRLKAKLCNMELTEFSISIKDDKH